MQITAPPELPLRLLLLAWIRYRIRHVFGRLKPAHGADDIAARVAGSGQPPGF